MSEPRLSVLFPKCERCTRLLREETEAEDGVPAFERFDALMRHLVRDHGLHRKEARWAVGIDA